ncbi:MAG: methylenetetrahydrofolate--tRNA-(uracil(54)-C(5))-methyltransferase (FADH(2)-oxidizing) TrmFO [Firmicutes bacterium]|nr:methylenetetrahydrofolate--tRNA-(uracil(54)-C(5))-methyltransferase (FADH(2)-oxidizing) TrmFO [Alicyclobacillaceae bacterium]MCL6496357.1 methylenetetrahydrofolate--tRNA-(uracil(54)-C(5))-methyltransferase (FADH(2)-oxidizing) TrmFO [Bacillota bacterium]
MPKTGPFEADRSVTVIGGGLAGSEAAWQIARRGVPVRLYEMRPTVMTPAHVTGNLAELVCSNSLGGDGGLSPAALLKDELRRAGSLILAAAEVSRVEAGGALAVDRERFSAEVTRRILEHPGIEVVREPVTALPPGPVVVATGPLTHAALSQHLAEFLGERNLAFFDAAAPIVTAESVDMSRAFWGSREGEDRADYLNCPLTKEEYERFYEALITAEQHPRHDFEQDVAFFEGCLPIEELARRGKKTPLFGPMKPVGLKNPLEGGRRPYAVVQLRKDNATGSLLNLVGFQTNLRWGEQKRVFSLIPALAHAEFVRYGVMHRNTYLCSPRILSPDLSAHKRRDLWIAGQITGVEGYVESSAMGLLAGINAARWRRGLPAWVPPRETMWGALVYYITHADPDHFQPMNANYGLLPWPEAWPAPGSKQERRERLRQRALERLEAALGEEMACVG